MLPVPDSLSFILILLVNLCCFFVSGEDNQTDIYLIGIFPFTGSWNGGQGMAPAADMAVEDINNRSDILPGYRLQMECRDTKCDPGLGVTTLAENVCEPPTKMMIIGEGCSTVSQAVAQAAHRWNLIQISYVSNSASLSNKEVYPNFFRLVTSESGVNEARMEILRHFNWRKVATMHQNYQLFSTMVEDLVKRMKEESFEIVAQVLFSEDPETAVRSLKEADARIIMAGFYRDKARKVFCHAYNMGFYGKQVWLTAGALSYDADWWKEPDPSINCTKEQLEKVVQNSLIVNDIYFNPNETEEGLTGMSVEKFRKLFSKRTENMTQPVSGADRAPTGYDSVWAAALALNQTMNNLTRSGNMKTLANFSYDDKDMAELIKSELLKVNFTSVSGRVSFDIYGDGIRLIGVQMIRGSQLLTVGKYDKTKPNGKRLEIEDVWQGNVPKDSIQTKKMTDTLSMPWYLVMVSLASLGIILALSFLSFNIINRNVRIIKMCSPNINNIILVGCILAYLSVYTEDIHDTKDSTHCKVKIFLLLMAFSLTFGGLFAKTWRIHAIFTAGLQLKRRKIQDHTLCLMIFGLVCLNGLILCVWVLVDPQEIVENKLDKTEMRDDMVIQYVNNYCYSNMQNYFLLTIMIIQGIMLLLGVFLAWETRKVGFSILNESRYIGMSIYNVVTLGVVGVLVSYTLTSNTSLVYVIISCITILCTTVTQCLLFVPKIMAYRKSLEVTSKDAELQFLPPTTTTATQTDRVDSNENLDRSTD